MRRAVPLREVEGGVVVRADPSRLVIVKDGKLYEVWPTWDEELEAERVDS